MAQAALYIFLGLVAGAASGLLGLGGGVIIVPVLVFLFGMSQHQAQGTTLVLMVPPVGVLAAWIYYQRGHANLQIGALIALGFLLGAAIGAKLANTLPSNVMERVFGAGLLLVSLKMLFGAKG